MFTLRNNVFLRLVFLLAAGTIGFVTPCARAQNVVLQLRNGDRLSGRILSEDTNQVTLSTLWMKEVSIPLAQIEKREKIAAPAPASSPAPAPLAATAAVTPGATATNTTNNAAVKPAAPATPVVALKPPATRARLKPPQHWHGDAQLGADVSLSEKNVQLYYGRLKLTYARDRLRDILDYNFAYGLTEGVLSANRMDGSSKTDYDLGKTRRTYLYTVVGAGYDELRKIDYRYEIGPGVGYHLITRSNFVLNTEAGMNYQLQQFSQGNDSQTYSFRLAQDSLWKITPKLTLDEKLEFYPSPTSPGEFRIRFEANLRYWFLENLSFVLSVIDNFDTTTARTVNQNDLQIRSSIGVKF